MQDADNSLILRERDDIPGLECLLSPVKMLETLRTYITHQEIISAQKRYIRYKPETNCIAKYDVTGGRGKFSIYAKAYRAGDDIKLQKAAQRHKQHSKSEHVHIDTEQHLVIYLFPHDEKLKLLPRLLDPDTRSGLLERVLNEPERFANCDLEVLQYKPERRLVAKLISPTGEQAVLKLYTRERFLHALGAVGEKVLGERLLNVIGRSDKHRIIVYQWLEGQCLTQEYQSVRFHQQQLENVGEYLTHFHAHRRRNSLKTKETALVIGELQQLALGVAHLLPQEQQRVQVLVDNLSRALNKLKGSKVRIHGDFYAKQVLLGTPGVHFIDLDDVCRWYREYDLGLFIAHLIRDCLANRLPASFAMSYQEALLKGYREQRQYKLKRVELFTAVGLLQLAHHPFRNAEPNWPQGIRAILCQCEHHFQAYRKLSKPHLQQETPTASKWDSKMPFIAQLQQKGVIEDRIKQALKAQLAEIDRYQLQQITALRHKQGKRLLLEYVFSRDAKPSAINVLGKSRAKGFDEHTWQLNNDLYLNGFGEGCSDGIQVPQPLGYLREFNIWFQRKVGGAAAFELIVGQHGEQALERIAQAIYKLHQCDVKLTKRHTQENELAILQQNLCTVSQQHLDWSARLEKLFDCCLQLSEQLPKVTEVPIHRDFYHDQLLIDADKLYLLDLDLMCYGDPALDIGNFVAHVQEQCLRVYGDLHYVDDKLDGFIHCYIGFAQQDITQSVKIYTLLSWVRHIFISQRIAERNGYTLEIIKYCELLAVELLE